MKFWSSKKFLNRYFVFQCVAIVISFLCIFLAAIISLAIWTLCGESMYIANDYSFAIICTSVIMTASIIYFISTIIAAIATNKLRKDININLFEKGIEIIFIIITIPLYILLIWSLKGIFYTIL